MLPKLILRLGEAWKSVFRVVKINRCWFCELWLSSSFWSVTIEFARLASFPPQIADLISDPKITKSFQQFFFSSTLIGPFARGRPKARAWSTICTFVVFSRKQWWTIPQNMWLIGYWLDGWIIPLSFGFPHLQLNLARPRCSDRLSIVNGDIHLQLASSNF